MTSVKSVLENLKKSGNKIKYFPNRGNAGDSLINVGFYMLADSIGLDYEIINYDDSRSVNSTDVVVTGGGGALVPEQLTIIDAYIEMSKNCKKLIILPQSIRGVDQFITNLKEDDIVFCRELPSYNYCQKLATKCNILIDHDMAFNVDLVKLLSYEETTDYKPNLHLYNVFRHGIFLYHKYLKSKISEEILAYRCDREINENLDVKRRKYNDISAIARFDAGGKAESFYSAKKFVELINCYEKITTDRLHVVIAAGVLGKKVKAYSNSYYKVEGIINYSMYEFENIKKA